MVVNTIVFDDEIVLFWDKEWQYPDGIRYEITVNGQRFKTEKTHFRVTDLKPQTWCEISVARVAQENVPAETLFTGQICTKVTKKRLDVTKAPYFAVGDNQTLNTKAIQKALDDCTADTCVYIPAGVYLTGALNVHSDTEIFVDDGAVLQGTANPEDYLPKRLGRFEGIERECYGALLNVGVLDYKAGYTCKNIVIRGGGSIFSGGKELGFNIIDRETELLKDSISENEEYLKVSERPNNPVLARAARVRSRLIAINNCENVVIGNVTVGFGACWNIHFTYSKNVVTYGCKILSKGAWNGDGWDPDSSEDCTIFNCEFNTQDDAIAIKSGKNPQGNIINRPTRNVRVFDCRGGHGVAIGSELSGGIENVYVWDCEFVQSVGGVRVKTTRKRGGYVKNLRVRNCKLADIRIWAGYNCNDDGESAGALTELCDFHYENVTVTGVSYNQVTHEPMIVAPVFLWGFEEREYYIKNVVFDGLTILARENGDQQNIAIKCVENVRIDNLNYAE